MKEIPLNKLIYSILNVNDPSPSARRLVDAAFQCWFEVWSDTFKELDGLEAVFSDDFTRQSYMGTVTHNEECLALGMFNEVDLSQRHWQKDSYFKVWPPEILARVSEGSTLIGNQITVRKDYRGDLGNGIYLKQLLVGLMTQTFIDSGFDRMVGTMRVNKGMHLSAHDFGAKSLKTGVVHHGVEVELVLFEASELRKKKFKTDLSVRNLWERRQDYRNQAKINQRKVG